MKRALIVCLFLLISGKSAMAATPYFPPLQPMDTPSEILNNRSNITSNPDPFVKTPPSETNITTNPTPNNYSNISKLEQTLFNRTFAEQNITIRLSRLEKKLFNTTYPNANSNKRIDNIISNCNQAMKYPNISKNVLSDLEEKVFGQKFPQNGPVRRIERLEQQVFGAVQSGDINARYDTLRMAVKAYNDNKYANTDSTAMPRRTVRNVGLGTRGWGSNTFMGGRMTGFTPPINPFADPFLDNNNNFGSSSFENNDYNNSNYTPNAYYNPRKSAYRTIGSGGYGNSNSYSDSLGRTYQGSRNTNTQTGVGVTILD